MLVPRGRIADGGLRLAMVWVEAPKEEFRGANERDTRVSNVSGHASAHGRESEGE